MKKEFKGFVAGVLVMAALFCMIGTAGAVVGKMQANLDYNNIKISLNGTQITPKDANGNVVEPFAINGTTYLPVRAVGESLGLDVQWDGNTKTVILTENSSGSNVSTADYASELYLLKYICCLARDTQVIADEIFSSETMAVSGLLPSSSIQKMKSDNSIRLDNAVYGINWASGSILWTHKMRDDMLTATSKIDSAIKKLQNANSIVGTNNSNTASLYSNAMSELVEAVNIADNAYHILVNELYSYGG